MISGKQNFSKSLLPKLDIERVVVGGSRYYKHKGVLYKSVTEHLSGGDFDDKEEWLMKRVRAGASRGDFLHNSMEDYVMGKPITGVPSIYQHLVQSLVDLADEHLTEVYAIEHMMVSKFLGLGGTADLIGLWGGKRSIIDWKGSTNIPWVESLDKYRKQGRIYGVMAKECHGLDIEQIVIAGVKENNETFLHVHDAIHI